MNPNESISLQAAAFLCPFQSVHLPMGIVALRNVTECHAVVQSTACLPQSPAVSFVYAWCGWVGEGGGGGTPCRETHKYHILTIGLPPSSQTIQTPLHLLCEVYVRVESNPIRESNLAQNLPLYTTTRDATNENCVQTAAHPYVCIRVPHAFVCPVASPRKYITAGPVLHVIDGPALDVMNVLAGPLSFVCPMQAYNCGF